ncbi:MAG: glycine betaine ABC transporter substrate-binding protein [Ilumatobacteraceae bacterium]
MTTRRTRPSLARRVLTIAAPVIVSGLVLSACGDSAADSDITIPPTPRVVVTSIEGDAESQLLAAIYSRALEDAGFRVVRRDPVTLDRDGYTAELEAGTIQLIPEWSADLISWLSAQGTDVTTPTTIVPSAAATTVPPVTLATTTTVADTTTTIAGETTTTDVTTTVPEMTTSTTVPMMTTSTTVPMMTTSTSTTTTVPAASTSEPSTTTTTIAPNGRGSIEQLTALTALLPDALAVNNGSLATKNNVIACSEAAVTAHSGVEFATLSNLASNAPDIVLGAPDGWEADDEFGLEAWTRIYGGTFDDVITVEADGIADAVENDTAGCFVVGSLDPAIVDNKLTVLSDDRSMFRANVAVALLNAEIATPDLLGALDAVATSLTSERLVKMLYEIEVNGADPVVVANAFVDTI